MELRAIKLGAVLLLNKLDTEKHLKRWTSKCQQMLALEICNRKKSKAGNGVVLWFYASFVTEHIWDVCNLKTYLYIHREKANIQNGNYWSWEYSKGRCCTVLSAFLYISQCSWKWKKKIPIIFPITKKYYVRALFHFLNRKTLCLWIYALRA